MIACIAGATGLTGSFLLNDLLLDPQIKKVYALVRKTTGIASEKLQEIVFSDDFSAIELPESPNYFFCCLGTTIKKAGSKEAFRQVDVILPQQLITMAEKYQAKSFVLQSSLSANVRSSNFYLHCKGEAEEFLRLSKISSKCTVRPSILVGPRKEFRLGERIGLFFMQILRPIFIGKLKRYRAVHVEKVAKAMIRVTKNQAPGWLVIESEAL
jgi:nucleoside-diphosphate-sugar epimerase